MVRKRLADGTVREYRYPRKKVRPPRHAGSMAALIEAYRASPEWRALRPKTHSDYLHHLDRLAGYGEAQARSVRRGMVVRIRDAVAAASGPAAANKFVRVASVLMEWAVSREWIETNPAARIPALQGGHLRAWTDAEFVRTVDKLPEALRRVFVLARYTGQRRGDLIAIRWSQYDGQTLRLKQAKTGAELAIPIADGLRAELAGWPRTAPQILTTERGAAFSAQRLSHRIRHAVREIDPALRGLNAHGLRKLCAASLAEAGCSAHEIAAITGHATLSMVQLYTRSARQEQLAGAAVARLTRE